MRPRVLTGLRFGRRALLCLSVFLLSFWWFYLLRGGAGDLPHIYFTYQSLLLFQSDIALWLTLTVWAGERLLCSEPLRLGPRGVWWAGLGLIGASVLSLIRSEDRALTAAFAAQLLLLAALYLMLINDGPEVQTLLGVWFAVVVIVQGVVALAQAWTQTTELLNPLNLFWPGALTAETRGASVAVDGAGERWLRAYGTLPHPNLLGSMLLAYLGAALAHWLAFRRRVWLMVLALGVGAVALTFSRAALLGLGAGIGMAWAGLPREARPSGRAALLVSAAVLGCSALFTGPYWLTRTDLSGAANPVERASTLERSLLIGYGLEAWRAQPLTGVGAGGFVQWAARHVPERYPFEPAHNVALLALAETGVAGALALTALVAAILWRMWRRRGLMTAAEAAWAAALVGMGITGLFDHLWWTQPPARALWVMALAAWVSAGRQRSSAASAPTPTGAMPNSRPASIKTSHT